MHSGKYGAYDEIEIDIHFGKEHGKNYNCGLCDYVANALESLEIHLKTCEIYRCTKCGNVAINLQNIKSHIQQDHEGENKNRVVHTKISRESTEEVTSKTYSLEEIYDKGSDNEKKRNNFFSIN